MLFSTFSVSLVPTVPAGPRPGPPRLALRDPKPRQGPSRLGRGGGASLVTMVTAISIVNSAMNEELSKISLELLRRVFHAANVLLADKEGSQF